MFLFCMYLLCIIFLQCDQGEIFHRITPDAGRILWRKAPKANWLIALIGAVILGVAYYMAVTITTPLLALQEFFIAVVMVIIATYILFTAGSVALCKLLEKNKKYYYHPNHIGLNL